MSQTEYFIVCFLSYFYFELLPDLGLQTLSMFNVRAYYPERSTANLGMFPHRERLYFLHYLNFVIADSHSRWNSS